MNCDMCGSEKDLFRCKIEDSYLNVCHDCSKHGTKIRKVETASVIKEHSHAKNNEPVRELIQIIVPNYSSLIKEKREQMGLKQKDLANKLAEKESLIHKIESNKAKPNILLARKFEKFLNITLVGQHEEIHKPIVNTSSGDEGMTIADLIKKK